MNITGPFTSDERFDFSIEQSYYSIKTGHGTKYLNTEGNNMLESEVTVAADDEMDVAMFVKASDGGIEEGFAQAYMTPEQALDLAERLTNAARARQKELRYYDN